RDSLEDGVEQIGFSASPRHIKSLLQSVVPEVRDIEVERVRLLAAKSPDIPHIYRQIRSDTSRDSEGYVFNVRILIVWIIGSKALGPIRDENRLHRLRGHEYRNQRLGVGHIQIRMSAVSLIDGGKGTGRRIRNR